MRVNAVFCVLVVVVLVSSGCLRPKASNSCEATGTCPQPTRVYVEPCNLANMGLTIRVDSDVLNAQAIKGSMEAVFVDDFNTPSGAYARNSYTLDCYWGRNVDEKMDRYYCVGRYKAPESDETKTIKRHVWKEFKIGMDVETHNLGSRVDGRGVRQGDDLVHFLTVKSVDGKCYIAD